LGLTDAAIYGLSRLPLVHKDPFDRILIVQAKLTGSTLVSPDKNFSKYPVEVFW
jgi:PIN domain nuclease of toxin-antitoxin system